MKRAIVVTSMLVLAACADPTGAGEVLPSPSTEAEFRALWDSRGPQDYAFTIERSCFCPVAGELRVTVEGGEVVSVMKGNKELSLDDDRLIGLPLTIEALFEEAAQADAEADRATIEHDPALGYPTRIDVDWWANAIDDEWLIEASDLRAAAS